MKSSTEPPPFFELANLNLENAWFILAKSGEVDKKPVAKYLLNTPIVLFRDSQKQVHALLDRCPHRGVNLSLGTVHKDRLVCRYHGWEFNAKGECTSVPSIEKNGNKPSCQVGHFATYEARGFIWVCSQMISQQKEQSWPLPPAQVFSDLDDQSLGRIIFGGISIKSFFVSAVENFWDVTHTRFVHDGLARVDSLKKVEAEVFSSPDQCDVVYHNEPFPEGLIFWILKVIGCKNMLHRDQYKKAGHIESLYEFDKGYFIKVQDFVTPNTDHHVTYYSVTSFRLPIPNWLFSFLGKYFAKKIVQQDQEILENQLQTSNQSKTNKITFVPGDFYLREILRILKRVPTDLGAELELNGTAVHRENVDVSNLIAKTTENSKKIKVYI